MTPSLLSRAPICSADCIVHRVVIAIPEIWRKDERGHCLTICGHLVTLKQAGKRGKRPRVCSHQKRASTMISNRISNCGFISQRTFRPRKRDVHFEPLQSVPARIPSLLKRRHSIITVELRNCVPFYAPPNCCKRLTKRRLFARAAIAALEQSALHGGAVPARPSLFGARTAPRSPSPCVAALQSMRTSLGARTFARDTRPPWRGFEPGVEPALSIRQLITEFVRYFSSGTGNLEAGFRDNYNSDARSIVDRSCSVGRARDLGANCRVASSYLESS